MISRKFACADNLALLHSSGNWKNLEGTLSQDVTNFRHISRLKKAKCELKVYTTAIDFLLLFPPPFCLGVKLDKLLTLHKKKYKKHTKKFIF